MANVTERVITVPANAEAGECPPQQDQAGPLEDKRIEQLSETLRTRARIFRQHNSNAYLYHRSELATWLGRDGHLLDKALEFMVEREWAGQFGLPDTWWIG